MAWRLARDTIIAAEQNGATLVTLQLLGNPAIL